MAQSKIRLGRGLGGIFAGAKGNSPAAKKPAVGKPVAGKAIASNSKSSGHSSKTASKTSQVSSSKKPVVKVSVPAKKGTGGSHGKANVRVKTPIAAATKRPAMVQQTRRPAVQISKSKQQSNVRVSTPQSPVKGGSQNSGKPVVKQATSSAATSGRTGYAQAVETTVKSGQRFSAGHRPNVQITASANRGHMSGVVTSRPDADEKVNAAYINQLEQVLREEDHEDIAEAGRELVLEMPHEAVGLVDGEAVSDDYLSEEEIESADQEDSDEYGVTNLAMDSDVDHAGEVDVVADELATQNEGATAYFGVENIVQEASDVEDEEAMLGEDEFSGNSSGDVGFARSATDGSQASQFVSHTGQARGGQYEGSVRREVMPVSFSVGSLKDFAEVELSKVTVSPYQPRRTFDEAHLQELANSIQSEGLMQPIVVRPVGDQYQLIAGERRFRACQMLGLKKIPARILNVSDASSAVLAMIENLQREGLNPIEEGLGYASLMRDFHLTQEAVAERVGKGRATVANSLRLLQLDREIQGYLGKGLISSGHAKVLLGVEDESQRLLIARRVVENSLSVRETERLVRQAKASAGAANRAARTLSNPSAVDQAIINDLEKQLCSKLNTKVYLKHTPKRGKIIIEYFGNEDLQRILERTGLDG